ncbi:MAG TPA: hypothetical protein DIC42_06920 [Holosporales bacterium]|nr:hypothetical protein [Holosporales bacterium]
MNLSVITRQMTIQKKEAARKVKTSSSEFNIIDDDQQDLSSSILKTSAPMLSTPLFFNEEPSSQKKKQFMQGNFMLDELHKLRLGLIQGRVSKDTLRHLDKLIQNKKNDSVIQDEKLKDILDDIETRVTVELEKIRMFSNDI